MTIENTVSQVVYEGDGSATVFPFEFLIPAGALVVELFNGTATVELEPPAYSVSGLGNPAGGSVTLASALATGSELYISRRVAFVQEVEIQNQQKFFANVVEGALDYLTLQTQQLRTEVARALLARPGQDPQGVIAEIEAAADSAATSAGIASAAAEAAAVFDPALYLDRATFDPQDISADVFNRENHTGTQDVSTITGLGELATRDRATVAQIRSLGSDAAPTAERIAEAAALISPSGASDWAPDWEDFISANWVLTGNRTLQNPTNVIPGTTRVVRAAGDSGTGRTISFGSNYQGDLNGGPVTSGSPILYTLFAATATEIWVSAMEAD